MLFSALQNLHKNNGTPEWEDDYREATDLVNFAVKVAHATLEWEVLCLRASIECHILESPCHAET